MKLIFKRHTNAPGLDVPWAACTFFVHNFMIGPRATGRLGAVGYNAGCVVIASAWRSMEMEARCWTSGSKMLDFENPCEWQASSTSPDGSYVQLAARGLSAQNNTKSCFPNQMRFLPDQALHSCYLHQTHSSTLACCCSIILTATQLRSSAHSPSIMSRPHIHPGQEQFRLLKGISSASFTSKLAEQTC